MGLPVLLLLTAPRPQQRQADISAFVEVRVESDSPAARGQQIDLRWRVGVVLGQDDPVQEHTVFVWGACG